MIIAVVPPSIQGLGFAGGFQMQIEDREGVGSTVLQERTQAITQEVIDRQSRKNGPGQKDTAVESAFSLFRAGVPQVYLNIDREKAEMMGVKVSDIFSTLQANLGSVYVNDFNMFSRTYQVRVQAAASFRGDTSVIRRLEVPGASRKAPP